MFAYCGNNPVLYTDSYGEGPVSALIIGGALGGALVSAALYSCSDEPTALGYLDAVLYGAVTGAIGGIAGASTSFLGLSATIIKWTGICANSILSAVYAAYSGGSFILGGLSGFFGTYAGTKFELFGEWFDIAYANYAITILTGMMAEMSIQAFDAFFNQNSSTVYPSITSGNNRRYYYSGGIEIGGYAQKPSVYYCPV